MINDTIEAEFTPEFIRAEFEKRVGHPLARYAEYPDEVEAALIAFLELEDKDRGVFIKALDNFVCRECGKASCLHGYSDE